MNIGSFSSAELFETRASRSKLIPLVTKKKGIRKPNPTAVSFDSNTSTSCPLSAIRVISPATKPPRRMSRPRLLAIATRPKTRTTAIRTASWLLDSRVLSSRVQPGTIRRTETSAIAIASATKATRISASFAGCPAERTRVIRRIGPNSPIAPAASRLVPKDVFSSLVVAEDRDQGSDRCGRHRRARVEEGDHDPGGGEQPADPVGERHRERPADRAEPQRPPADPLEVDLVAGEEEEHPEAEVREELDELICGRDVEKVGADEDSQQQLEDDDRRREAPGEDRDGQRGDRRHHDDDEEGACVDRDHRARSAPAASRTRRRCRGWRRSPRPRPARRR